MKIPLAVEVNHEMFQFEADPRETLLDLLKHHLKINSLHRGCEQGECGACTVLLNGKPVCSCLVPSPQVDGATILTLEGLSRNGKTHPLVEAFLGHNAIQCGYCTPGMILTAYYLVNQVSDFSEKNIRKGLEGNLCRCTGYVNILKAIQAAKKEKDSGNWW